MRTVILIVFSLLVSFCLGNFKFYYYTWQFWAIGIPTMILYHTIECKLFPKKNKR